MFTSNDLCSNTNHFLFLPTDRLPKHDPDVEAPNNHLHTHIFYHATPIHHLSKHNQDAALPDGQPLPQAVQVV
jgi:hypothetical protein